MKLLLGLLIALPALAADFAGTWQFSYKTPSGVERDGDIELKINGDEVTGNITSAHGAAAIDEGHIHGADISFRLIRRSIYDEIEVRYEGKLENGILRLKMQYGSHNPIAITANRRS